MTPVPEVENSSTSSFPSPLKSPLPMTSGVDSARPEAPGNAGRSCAVRTAVTMRTKQALSKAKRKDFIADLESVETANRGRCGETVTPFCNQTKRMMIDEIRDNYVI